MVLKSKDGNRSENEDLLKVRCEIRYVSMSKVCLRATPRFMPSIGMHLYK